MLVKWATVVHALHWRSALLTDVSSVGKLGEFEHNLCLKYILHDKLIIAY